MIRAFDIFFSLLGLVFLSPLFFLLCALVWLETRSPIFKQTRVGRYQTPFLLVKLRTMRSDTPSVATHLVGTSGITQLGLFLRRTKLDELPQLWNVFLGDMSLVGPRPCLFNQQELVVHRAALDVFAARPGLTGLAQVQGIDMSTPELLAKADAEMLSSLNVWNYFRYIFLTLVGKGCGDRISY